MRVVVVGGGMAGLTAARLIDAGGHRVTVLDKGRRPGGRMATKQLGSGAAADHGAQFFTVRSEAFAAVVHAWVADGTVHEWCRGFSSEDGHPRYAVANGMAQLAAHMSSGLDVRSSMHVDTVRSTGGRWSVTWPATERGPAGTLEADVVVLTAPAPQSAALVSGEVTIPDLDFEPALSLLVALREPPAIPAPGGVQPDDDPTWSWIGDNVAKGASAVPAVTLHTHAGVASSRWGEPDETLVLDLVRAAQPWIGGAEIIDARVHRWRYATPITPYPDPCLVEAEGGLVFAGDAFGGPRVEGAFLSGRAAADAVLHGRTW